MLHLLFHNFVSPVASTVVNHSGRNVAAYGMYARHGIAGLGSLRGHA